MNSTGILWWQQSIFTGGKITSNISNLCVYIWLPVIVVKTLNLRLYPYISYLQQRRNKNQKLVKFEKNK